MSQTPRLGRARQLTSPVVPARSAESQVDRVAARLRKIAAGHGTGRLPFTGSNSGAIYLTEGKVAHAESRGTPGPDRAQLAVPGYGDPSQRFGRIVAIRAVTEATVDAVLDLLSSESRLSRFRPARAQPAAAALSIPLDALLAEVARRQRLLRQMSAVLTADTAVVRNPNIPQDAIRVSALQWALLIRMGPVSTPRDLAWALGRSLFSTTAEIYRLLTLRLISVDRRPGVSALPGEPGSRGSAGLSFLRAVSVRKGDTMQLTPGVSSGADR
jgi:hypothetical protein